MKSSNPAFSRSLSEYYMIACRFLSEEAKILDERSFDKWMEMVDDEIQYEIPIIVSKNNLQDETAGGGHRINDNKARLRVRVDRLKSGHAWSETPPSRTVRIVGSILANPIGDGRTLDVESSLLLYRQRGDSGPGDVIPVRRYDVLRVADDVTLLKRRVIFADTSLRTPNLGIFL